MTRASFWLVLLATASCLAGGVTFDTPNHESYFTETGLANHAVDFARHAAAAVSGDSGVVDEKDAGLALTLYENDGQDRQLQVCNRIGRFFDDNVDCECYASLLEGIFNFTCRYEKELCSPLGNVCGQPSYAGSIDATGEALLGSTVCVTNMTRNNQTYQDLCVSTSVCLDDFLCGCDVTYGGESCHSCDFCEGGLGVVLNCTNHNPEVVYEVCTDIDLNFNLRSSWQEWIPDFDGSCSYLERLSEGAIVCDCTGAEGNGSELNLTCAANKEYCLWGYCSNVTSDVQVVDGRLLAATTCVEVDLPDLLSGLPQPLCTSLTACDPADNESLSLCASSATLGGSECTTELCNGTAVKIECADQGVVVDCTNVSVQNMLAFTPEPKMMDDKVEEEDLDSKSNGRPVNSVGMFVVPLVILAIQAVRMV